MKPFETALAATRQATLVRLHAPPQAPVREYVIEGQVDAQWQALCHGTAIGHKEIDRFEPTKVTGVRLRCLKSAAQPLILALVVYNVGTKG